MNGSNYFLVRLGFGLFFLSSFCFIDRALLTALILIRSCPRALASKMSLDFSFGFASMTELSGN